MPDIAVALEDRAVELRHLPSPDILLEAESREDAESRFRESLRRELRAEMRAGRPLVGPQRDDLEIRFGGTGAAEFGSAGEVRRAAFQLVLAAHEITLETGNSGAGVLLIDDIDSELDDTRLGQVFRFISQRGQVLVTTAKKDVARRLSECGTVVEVEAGSAGPSPVRSGA